jgi:hypothetical protein
MFARACLGEEEEGGGGGEAECVVMHAFLRAHFSIRILRMHMLKMNL